MELVAVLIIAICHYYITVPPIKFSSYWYLGD